MQKLSLLSIFSCLIFLFQPRAHAHCNPKEIFTGSADFKVGFLEYQPEEASENLVIIVPPTGGANLIDRSYAKNLCKNGIHAVILKEWTNDQEFSYELEIHTRFYSRAQLAIDVLQEHFKDKTIGLLGTSVGALHAAIAFARSEKISSAFLIVGGADIASIIVNSDQQVMRDAKATRFKTYGFKSDLEYKQALEKILPFEPSKIKFDRAQKKLAMVISTKDSTVPGANQTLLKDLWQPDFVYTSNWEHFGSIIKTWLCDTDEILKFFKTQKK